MAKTVLREIYEKKLSSAPFPTAECSAAHITGNLHGELIVYLAGIAGLAGCIAAMSRAAARSNAAHSSPERGG